VNGSLNEQEICGMTGSKRLGGRQAWLGCGLFALAVLVASPHSVQAQPAAAADDGGNAMVHLIQVMIKNGQLTPAQAEPLLREAEEQRRPARQRTRAQGSAAAKPPVTVVPPTAAPDAAAGGSPMSVHVTYVPELVRQQIAAEVKQQVMQEAREEGWAEPNALPEWTQRIRVFGDIRLRGEQDMLPSVGNPPGEFPDFNTINSSANGFDANAPGLPPLLDMNENRTRFRLRARLGVDAELNDWSSAEIRLGTGNDRNPVSENQTLGAGGDFSKYAIWLDRAYVRLKPTTWLTIDLGRAPDPFWTTPLLFYSELNFDGISVQAQHAITDHLTGFLTVGGFPVFNTSFNFGLTNSTSQPTNSHDAYLVALQGGGEWKINDDYVAKMALGYFNFLNVQGSESSPCLSPTGFGSCSTDNQVPGWIQYGNTLFPLRNIIPNPPAGSTVTPNPQFFGLASRFNVLDVHGELSVLNFHPLDIVFTGDFVKNLGFNASAIAARGPSNNFGANSVWSGGGNGYLVQVTFGHQQLEKSWDWNLALGYRYIESDAVLDGLTDSDFYPGGTNVKMYTFAANLALDRNVWVDTRFYSGTQVSGPDYISNTLLVDLNAKF
jgi:hypothetical protein